jgi:Tol biopolymer transport system component
VPAGDTRHSQITRVGNVRGVAFSPDGRMAAYVARTADDARVMVRDVAGTGSSLEIWRGDIVVEIQWMPDGAHVLVSGIAPGATSVQTLLVPRLTGTPRPLVEAGAHVAVSPDGSEVALAYQNTRGFRIVRLDGGPARKVEMQGFQFLLGLDWGAATNRIAVLVQNADNSSSVWIVGADGSNPRMVYSDPALLASLRWSPFGNVIYLIRSRNEAAEVLRIDPPDGGGVAAATVLLDGLPWDPSDQYQQQASLSTDGRRLLYVRGSASSNIWKMTTRLPGEAAPVTEGTSRYGAPTVSPDGQWMAASLGSVGESHLVKLPIAGGDPVVLTTAAAADRNPMWSPDGKRVAFVSTRGGKPRIWLADPQGLPPTEVPDSDADVDARIAWMPDGKLLWQLPGSHDYAIHDLASGARETLAGRASDRQWTADARFAPRGDRLALWINRGSDKTALTVMRWPERTEESILDGPFFPAGWSPAADWVYAYEYLGRQVVRVPAAGGKPQPIGRFPSGAIEGCSVTADGRTILCGVGETNSDAWLVENFDPRAPQPR